MGKQNINDKEHILVCLSSAPSNPKNNSDSGSHSKSNVASLRVFMATLRKKIEPSADSPQYIQTHVGIGYRMIKAE